MTTDAAPNGWDSILDKGLEMITMAHGTWNKRYAMLTSYNKEIKAITQVLLNFAKTLKNLRVRSLAIRNDNSTAVFDIRKLRASISLIKEIQQELENEFANTVSRLSRTQGYKLKEKIFLQKYLYMNLNQTINLFSQHFNNLLPRFMSTIRGYGEIAINAFNQTQEKELPWIHPAFPLLPAVLKKIREEQIEAMIIAQLQSNHIWQIKLGAIDTILQGQRYSIQGRYYYAMEKLKKWTQINHCTILDLLTMKPHIIITEVLAQFTSVNTSASSALQFLNGGSSIPSLTFDIDLKNNHMFQFTRIVISAHMIVKPKYEDTWNVGILFDYWRMRGLNRNLTNIELQTKHTSLLMTICSMRPAEIEGKSLKH
ncbi:MAG: hypothetical protein EZS28_000973 [Streblomastix strix]|uniref:Uncharacterized protein n=1 Tax=Streblomastix strix TaxID=222440 RepID=A0A5J4X8E6_9EUKA|nr:MAG: hypothetical protein EZS28_000973 [Streblomastix strix]